jgi:protocatechuate 3,4-dioxygenase beta subunit
MKNQPNASHEGNAQWSRDCYRSRDRKGAVGSLITQRALIVLVCLCAGPAMFGQAVPAKGSIEGQVVDAKTNAPIRKVAVTLQGSAPFARAGQPPAQNAPRTAETDAQGNFTFRDLDAANYQINCQQRQGYVTMPYQGYPSASVVLGRGQDLKGVIVKLAPQAVITGKVLDEDGEPVQWAQVSVLRRDEPRRGGGGVWNNAGQAQTNDVGEYRIAGITPGSYVVRATWRNNMAMPYYPDRSLPSGPVLAYIPTHYTSAPDVSTATVLTVDMGAEVRGIDIRLRKAKTVSVRGRLEGVPASAGGNGFGGGGPMPWVNLLPRDAKRFDNFGNMAPAMRQDDGTFEIDGVLPGAYLLTAQFNDQNAKQSMAAVKPVDVSDKPIEGIVLRLDVARDVQGTVVVEENTQVKLGNATVRLTMRAPTQGRFPQPAHIEDRQFTLKDVLPFPASVEVDNLPRTCYMKEVRYGGRPVPPEGVDLTSGEQLEIVLSTAVAELAGTVVDSNGKAVPSALVTLTAGDAAGWPPQTNTDRGGDFALSVKPGEYQAVAWEAIDANLLTPDFLKHFAGRTTMVKLAPGAHEIAKLTVVSLADTEKLAGLVPPVWHPGSIAGTVVDSMSGAPVRYATVTLKSNGGGTYYPGLMRRPRGPENPYSTETDDHGRFSISDIDPGFYQIATQAHTYAASARNPYDAEDQTVVGDGQHLTDVVVKISPQAVITGRIVDEDGEPLWHVQVSALTKPDNRRARQWRPAGNSQTDDRGEYRIANLQPGSYLVRATYRSRSGPTFEQPLPEQPEMTYRAQFYPDAAEPESAKPVNVAAGAEVTGIDMKMQRAPTVRVRGKVTGEEPGSRVNLRLLPKQPHDGFPPDQQTATRGQEGEFEFSGVKPGSYYLIAGGFSDSRFAVQSLDVGAKHIDGLTLELAHGRDVRAAFKMEGGGRGWVFFNLVPAIASIGLPPINQNLTEGDTTLTLANVAPIPYTIGENFQPDYYLKSVVQGGQPVTGHTIDFGVPGLLEITVSSGAARVEAAVVDSKGKPVPNAVVALAPASGASAAVRTGTADAQGKFNFASLAPGDYRVAAWAAIPSGSIEDADFVRQSAGNSAPLSLAPRDRKTVQVTAKP